jgi:hypothetical protein
LNEDNEKWNGIVPRLFLKLDISSCCISRYHPEQDSCNLSVFDASCPILSFSFLSSAFSERIILFDRKAWKKIQIKVPK